MMSDAGRVLRGTSLSRESFLPVGTARRSMAWPTEMFLPLARRREASKL